MTWVLDASAIVCWLRKEDGVERFRAIVADERPCIQHAVNTIEVGYILWHKQGEPMERIRVLMEVIGVEMVREVDEELLRQTVQLKIGQAPISLADAFAVALAVQRRATLVTTDRGELEKVARAGVCPIEFLR